MRSIVIGTRGSSLALCQAQIVQARLEERHPECRFTLQTIKVQADKNPELSLTAISGEGVFVKELETALLDGRIDLAVHSLKDLPLNSPAGLQIAAVLERDEPRDALVARSGQSFEELPKGVRVGTSSLRRRSQLLHARGDLTVLDIRGNVDTRLRKLDEGRYDAIVVAACGLIRLGLEERITELLAFNRILPEPGQGALAIETRADDRAMLEVVSRLNDPVSRASVEAERAFLRALGGGCRVPIAAYAACEGDVLQLEGAVIAADGHRQLRGAMTAPLSDAVVLGERLAQHLISQGALALLKLEDSRLKPLKVRVKSCVSGTPRKGFRMANSVPASPESEQSLTCPSCHAALKMVLDEGAPVHACEQCKGVWVNFVDEKTLMQMKPEVFTVDELKRLRKFYQPLGKDDPVRLRACPVCHELMYRRNWGEHSGVIVDRCEQHGTWYDEGEVEKIREYIQLGGVEFEKLRIAEQGLSELETKMDQRTAELDLRTIQAYRRARLWSLFGF